MAEQDLPYTLDYEALVKARGTLQAAAEALYYAPAVHHMDAHRNGIVYQAFEAAGDALFTALNVAANHGHDAEALRVVHMTEWAPAEMTPEEEIEETHRRR